MPGRCVASPTRSRAAFLAEHLAQLRTTKKLIAIAEAKGNSRLVEMNQRVATNLENIIDAIQAPEPAETGDAS